MCTLHAGKISESSFDEKRKGCTLTQNHKFIQMDILIAVGSSSGQTVYHTHVNYTTHGCSNIFKHFDREPDARTFSCSYPQPFCQAAKTN